MLHHHHHNHHHHQRDLKNGHKNITWVLCKNILLAQYTCNELLVAGCDTHLHTAIQGAPAAADSEHHQGQWRREKRKTVCPHITHVTSVLSTKNAKSASHTQSDNLCFACPFFSKNLYNFLLEKKNHCIVDPQLSHLTKFYILDLHI